MVDEFLERRLERLDRQVHDPGEHVGCEAAPDDRPGAGRRLGLLRPMRHPGKDGVVDRLGHSRVADRGAIRPCLGAEGPEQLLDVERDPVGPLEDRGRDLARGRQARVEDERRREGRLLAGQRPKPDLLGDALGDQADTPVTQARSRRDVFDPVVGDDEQRVRSDRAAPARR